MTVACPTCGRPAILVMHAVDGHRFDFEFVCRGGHEIREPRLQQLWISAHQ